MPNIQSWLCILKEKADAPYIADWSKKLRAGLFVAARAALASRDNNDFDIMAEV